MFCVCEQSTIFQEFLDSLTKSKDPKRQFSKLCDKIRKGECPSHSEISPVTQALTGTMYDESSGTVKAAAKIPTSVQELLGNLDTFEKAIIEINRNGSTCNMAEISIMFSNYKRNIRKLASKLIPLSVILNVDEIQRAAWVGNNKINIGCFVPEAQMLLLDYSLDCRSQPSARSSNAFTNSKTSKKPIKDGFDLNPGCTSTKVCQSFNKNPEGCIYFRTKGSCTQQHRCMMCSGPHSFQTCNLFRSSRKKSKRDGRE